MTHGSGTAYGGQGPPCLSLLHMQLDECVAGLSLAYQESCWTSLAADVGRRTTAAVGGSRPCGDRLTPSSRATAPSDTFLALGTHVSASRRSSRDAHFLAAVRWPRCATPGTSPGAEPRRPPGWSLSTAIKARRTSDMSGCD